MPLVRKLHFIQNFINKGVFLVWMHALESGIKLKMLLDVQEVPEHVKLRTNTDLETDDIKLVSNVKTSNPGIAVGGLVEPGQLRNQSGLSRSIRSQ